MAEPSSPPPPVLRLRLLARTMASRLLSCLVVHKGTAFTTEIRGREVRVAGLQVQLCARISDALGPSDLSLFLARRDRHDGTGDLEDWLVDTDEDVYALALGNDTPEGEAAMSRFLTPRNWMDPKTLVHAYFPEQPPLFDRSVSAIHVLVRVGPVEQVIPTGLIQANESRRDLAAKLVASFQYSRLDVVRTRVTNGRSKPMLVRCREPRGMLWLGDDNQDDHRDEWPRTSFYIPSVWRELSQEIFNWAITGNPSMDRKPRFMRETKGRRAILTGAPRVGKSVFVSFLLLELLRLRSRPVCIVDVPGVTFARVDSMSGRVEEGNREVDFSEELSDAATVYLFDVSEATDELVAPLGARLVYARSIIVRPNQFIARSTKRTQSFVVPQWSLPDVQACAQHCFPSLAMPDVVALFHLRGGVPGRLFTRDAARSEAVLEEALARITPRQAKHVLSNVHLHAGWSEMASSDAVWHALVVPVGQQTTHTQATGDAAFTSQFVCDRVLMLVAVRTRVLRSLATPSRPALWPQVRACVAFLAQEEEEKHEG